ncbi:coiled-coil domain-containing protein 107 [Gopherus flavomarginatus]|uniref:coiled-coil domain-containing protein 107 n=1 Tax=Gopherus flavomarginatus TaxID=286002 RepID=UPI0021CC0C53|nr:coiled-coil domain-containing protein 107 [Gopherus flavomarginatus]
MAVSALQQGMVSVVLLLCLFVAVPRLFGGGGGAGRALRGGKAGPGRSDPYPPRTGASERVHQSHLNSGSSQSKTYQSFQQMRNVMEKDRKSERTRGSGKDLAFTLMPLYAVGVGVFAAYKFLKMKSQEGSSSKKEKNTEEEKAKETEHQLLELEQHLAQTEKILNSLLTQLDPLSNCVNALACEQKDEIMTQLQSIRQLMKESGLDKSEVTPKDVNHTYNEKLEDLIQSFGKHTQEKAEDSEDRSIEDLLEDTDGCSRKEEHELCDCEFTLNQLVEPKVIEVQEIINREILDPEETELRRRNKYELNMHI